MSNNIYFILGGKGGVGKSLLSSIVIDRLMQEQEHVLLVETDNVNSDVYKAYAKAVSAELIDLDTRDGWLELIDICEKHYSSAIVINSAARNANGLNDSFELFRHCLPELQRELICLWVINRQRDSLELLNDFIEILPAGKIHVVRNEFFGKASTYDIYLNSNLRKIIEDRGGQSLALSTLATRVCDDLNRFRFTIEEGIKAASIGNRVELLRWRNQFKSSWEKIHASK